MRFLLAAIFILPITAQPRIEGTVINALTGVPIRNATIELIMTPVLARHTVRNYSTNSDADGRFVFDAIDAATYDLRAERAGYVSYHYGSLLGIRAPAQVTNFVVKLTPQGLISGRVVDDDGEPVPDAIVEVMQRRFVNGKRVLERVGDNGTQGDGGYAIGGLAPGRYYVRAAHRVEQPDDIAPGRRNEIRLAFEPAMFPSAIDAEAGAQVRGIDIVLKRTRVFRVSGIVKGNSDDVLRLVQPDGALIELEAEVEDGHFEFRDVLPGTYELQSGTGDQKSELRGFTTVTVRGEDVKGVVITPSESPTVTGRLIFETGRCTFRVDNEYVQLKPDGAFVMHPRPRVSEIDIHCYPDDHYVKSISLSGQKIDGRRVDFSSGTTLNLDITISPHAAHIAGPVSPNTIVQICDALDLCITRKGAIPPEGLAPGDYRVFAWADLMDDIITVPEFRAKFESQATKVKLTENSTENVDLTVISKEAMAIEAAKIP